MKKQSKKSVKEFRPEPVLHIEDREYQAWPTQKQVAETLGVHPKTVYRWQKGTQRPDKNTLLLLQILFCGLMPWPRFDQYRAMYTGTKTYHGREIWSIAPRGGGRGISPTQLDAYYMNTTSANAMRDNAERKLQAMTWERDQLSDTVQQLEQQADDLRAEIKRLEDIILERQKARSNVIQLIKG